MAIISGVPIFRIFTVCLMIVSDVARYIWAQPYYICNMQQIRVMKHVFMMCTWWHMLPDTCVLQRVPPCKPAFILTCAMDTTRGNYRIRIIIFHTFEGKSRVIAPKIFHSVVSIGSWYWNVVQLAKFQQASTQVRVGILSVWQNFNTHVRICVQFATFLCAFQVRYKSCSVNCAVFTFTCEHSVSSRYLEHLCLKVPSYIKEYSLNMFPIFIFKSFYLRQLISQKLTGTRTFTLRYQ